MGCGMKEEWLQEVSCAVRWAPGSAYWSDRLCELLGKEALEGINTITTRYQRTHSLLEEAKGLLSRALYRLGDGDSLTKDIKQFLNHA